MALSKIDVANMVENEMPQANIANNVNFRNIIINGDMSIAQRGSSSTNVSTGYHTCDRWRIFRGAGTITMSQETDAPTGSGLVKSVKFLEAGSGSSPSAGDRNFLQHRIEGQNLQYIKKGTSSAEKLTLSFHVKSTVTGTYIAELYDQDNTRQVSKAYTISSANTWEYKTITFPADTSGTLDNDSANSMNLNLYFTVGSNFTSGTLNTTWNSVTEANRAAGQVNVVASANGAIQWTGVQLEVSDTASDFEFLPTDVSLDRCKRYFQKTYPLINSPGADTDDGMVFNRINSNFTNKPYPARFEKEVRTNSPTITIYSKTGVSGSASNFATTASHSSNDALGTISNIGSTGFGYIGSHGGSSGDGFGIHYTVDAEL